MLSMNNVHKGTCPYGPCSHVFLPIIISCTTGYNSPLVLMVGHTNRRHTQLSQSVKVHTSCVFHFTNTQCSRESQSEEPVFIFFYVTESLCLQWTGPVKPEITIATRKHFHEVRVIVMHVILAETKSNKPKANHSQPKSKTIIHSRKRK